MIADQFLDWHRAVGLTFRELGIQPDYYLTPKKRHFQPVAHDEEYWKRRIMAYEILAELREIEVALQGLVKKHVINIDTVVRVTKKLNDIRYGVKQKLRE